MAFQAFSFVVTIPPSTPSSAPLTTNLAVGTDPVVRIRWRVPPGPRGHMSFAIAQSGVFVIPSQLGAYITADNEFDDFTSQDLPETGAWQLIGFNTGTFAHSVYLQFFTDPAANLPAIPAGNIDAGFPTSDADIPSLWLT
jgi:hypothetical protein